MQYSVFVRFAPGQFPFSILGFVPGIGECLYVLVVEVQPSEYPLVRYRGCVWVRVGPRKSIATEAEVKILTERRLSTYIRSMRCRAWVQLSTTWM